MTIDVYNPMDNLKEILFLDREAVEDFFEQIQEVWNQKDLLDIPGYYTEKEGHFLVGKIENRIMALCGFIPTTPGCAELKRLRVKKELRGKGYGSVILSRMEEVIKKRGYHTIEFTTASVRESTLIFYKNRGYRETGRSSYGKLITIAFKKSL